MAVEYRDGERRMILQALVRHAHYPATCARQGRDDFHMWRSRPEDEFQTHQVTDDCVRDLVSSGLVDYVVWRSRPDDEINAYNVSDEYVRDLVSSGLVDYGQPGEPLQVTDSGRLEASGLTVLGAQFLKIVRDNDLVARPGGWGGRPEHDRFVADHEMKQLVDDGAVAVGPTGSVMLTRRGSEALELYSPTDHFYDTLPDSVVEPTQERGDYDKSRVSDLVFDTAARVAESSAPRQLESIEATFLLALRSGSAKLSESGEWAVDDGLVVSVIDDVDLESRFGGLVAHTGVTIELTALGHDALAAWETARKLEDNDRRGETERGPDPDEGKHAGERVRGTGAWSSGYEGVNIAENHADLVQENIGRKTDTEAAEEGRGESYVGVEYDELARSVTGLLLLHGVAPADESGNGRLEFTHSEMVTGLKLVARGRVSTLVK